MTIRRMRFACWITNASDTHSEHVMLIGFPREQMLRERVSTLRHTCIACVVLHQIIQFVSFIADLNPAVVIKYLGGCRAAMP